MKQLTGLDAAFLYMETPTTFGHVTGLLIFERPSTEFDPYAAVYAKYAWLVGQLEPLRRRLVEVPLGLDHPYWLADPDLDLDFHVREIHLARPGMVDQLAEQVSRIVGRPMDRSRPLWEVYVIDGLHSGRWALLTKYHHATIDGAAGQLMLNILTDTEPDAPTPGGRPVMGVRAAAGQLRSAAPDLGQFGEPPGQGDAGSVPDRSSARRRRRHQQRAQRGRSRRRRRQGDRATR
jgi:WS/DGAT/MGAT family acyltransferase